MSISSSPDDNSIDFEKVSIEDAAKVESPAAHAKRMEELSKRYDIQPKVESFDEEKLGFPKSGVVEDSPSKLISSYEAALKRLDLNSEKESTPVSRGDEVKNANLNNSPEGIVNESESDVKSPEQLKLDIERNKKIEGVSSFDDLFEVMNSFDDYMPMKSGGFVSVSFTKSLIKKYLSGETPIYVKDMLDSLKNHSDGSDALKGITSNYGLRKKVYDLLRKEDSVKYVTLKGEIKNAGEKSENVTEGKGLDSQGVVMDSGVELSQPESKLDNAGEVVENADANNTDDIVNGLTKEQKIIQHERDLSGKFIGDNIELHAGIQNIILDLIKEKGLDIKKENIDKILTLVPQRDGITIVTTGGVFTFLKAFTGERVIYVNDIQKDVTEKGALEINSDGQRELHGEEADGLWEDYKPEIILELYDEAEEIYNNKEHNKVNDFENETDTQFSERFKSYLLDRSTKKAKGEIVESDEEFKAKMSNINKQRLAVKMKKGFTETN